MLERLIGLDLKLRQYEQGKAFCDGVVAHGGIAALNRAWAARRRCRRRPSSTTRWAWLARTERLGLGRGAA